MTLDELRRRIDTLIYVAPQTAEWTVLDGHRDMPLAEVQPDTSTEIVRLF